MMVAGNKLGDEGMVALAPALSKLVALTSICLGCAWVAMRPCVSLISGGVEAACVWAQL